MVAKPALGASLAEIPHSLATPVKRLAVDGEERLCCVRDETFLFCSYGPGGELVCWTWELAK